MSGSGRLIRAALVVFPLGTILLGIASFGIWSWKKDRVEDRNLRHASALRQGPTEAGRDRHLRVLSAVSEAGEQDRLASTASYMESSLGAEGMGYDPQRFVTGVEGGQPTSGVVAELTGKRRPKEVVLVLVSYGAKGRVAEENATLASVLTLANWVTGEPVMRTLRFLMLPLEGMDEAGKREVLERYGEEMRRRNERLLHLVDASAAETALMEWTLEELEMAARGAVTRRLEWPRVVDEGGYGKVREMLLGLAERP
jgi:hypothetical protein